MLKLLRISILFAVALSLIISSCKDDNKDNGENITNNENNQKKRSEERRVGKECRSRWAADVE